MDVLVVGSGGREHALAWRLSKSPSAGTVHVAPGNGGTENCVGIPAGDAGALADFAEDRGCFTVVGPEAPLAAGIVDRFRARGLRIFGPTAAAARLESSKEWAKGLMGRAGVRTARHAAFGDEGEALRHVAGMAGGAVVKADGLAAGKGVAVCAGPAEAAEAVRGMMSGGRFGAAGARVVVEERLEGEEASYIAMCDGRTAVPMATSMDYKRALDGGRGPNTGGMGAVSPAPSLGGGMGERIRDEVIGRTVARMAAEGAPFSGFLYAGIMVCGGEPYVLEYNARMGDPECQAIMMRADFDLLAYMEAAADGRLESMPPPRWSPAASACVVMASEGYPGKFPRGEEISGLGAAPPGAAVFHAGTRREGGRTLTDGGRVLGVAAGAATAREAAAAAYGAAAGITWPHAYMRRDVGS